MDSWVLTDSGRALSSFPLISFDKLMSELKQNKNINKLFFLCTINTLAQLVKLFARQAILFDHCTVLNVYLLNIYPDIQFSAFAR